MSERSAAMECYRQGKRTLHVFAKEPDKPWPYDGQVCVCGQVKFKAGYGASKP